jgi:hypothetical protein
MGFYRDKAVEIINQYFDPFGFKVVGEDWLGNTRIEFRNDACSIINDNPNGKTWIDEEIWENILNDMDADYVRDGRIDHADPSGNAKLALKIVNALTAASREFDDLLLKTDEVGQVMACPDENLPLLMTQITNADAKKILGWRLKGGSNG